MRRLLLFIVLVSLIFGYNAVSSKEKPKKAISLHEKMQKHMDTVDNTYIICDYVELIKSDTLHFKDSVINNELRMNIYMLIDGEKLVICRPKAFLPHGDRFVNMFFVFSQMYYDELYYALELARNKKIKICLTGYYTFNGDFIYSRIAVLGNLFVTGEGSLNRIITFPHSKKPL
jgi:hypothetical protein